MAVTTSYPGVYLSEEILPSFSVSGASTAVPLFLRTKTNQTDHLPGGNVLTFNSWQEFQSIEDISESAHWIFYRCIHFWFLNGGGKCYLAAEEYLSEAVECFDDITLVVAAGADDNRYSEFLALVDKGYRLFGLFDGKNTAMTAADTPETIMAGYSASPYAGVYYPNCLSAEGMEIPPSVVAAVTIAITDRTRGIWKAPANVVINGIIPIYPVSDDLQGRFNQGKALNMIRTFPGTGTVVWGARTLEDSDNWRYIPVRRLFNMVERDIQRALNKLVFEPNIQPTWMRVKAAVDNYLYGLWEQGALPGNKQEEAWFVEIGKDITMTEDDINQGKMIVKIGLAAVRPAEFILLQFSQDIAQ